MLLSVYDTKDPIGLGSECINLPAVPLALPLAAFAFFAFLPFAAAAVAVGAA